MFSIRRSVLAAAVALAVSLPVPAHADGGAMKVAVVDVQRAVAQTEDGLRAQAMLKKIFEGRQQELNKKQDDLEKQKKDLEQQAKVLSKDAQQRRFDELQKQLADLQQTYVNYSRELEKKQKELTDPIVEKILGIIKRLAARDGYDVVLDKQTVAYIRSDLDLTDQAIQLYNSGGGGPAAPEKK
jgi:outer membrane protein